ncbi:MAG: hypothetical protein LBL95_00170 [Deltaproteobacteria bacterium]|nr:hypothetical protein [Deltaproteobacteria bacterium]
MIINDELVTRITEEILRRLRAAGQGQAPAAKRPPLLVVGPLSALGQGCRDALAARFDLVPISGLSQDGRPEAPLLVTSLGLQALVQVASGDEGCTEEGRAILSALIAGRPAVALESGLAWRSLPPTAPRVLLSLYQTSEALLKNAGLRIAPESGLLPALTDGPAPAPAAGGPQPGAPACCPAPRGARVLTESAVSALFPEGSTGTLRLARGDILTPLARDLLLARKIAVSRE